MEKLALMRQNKYISIMKIINLIFILICVSNAIYGESKPQDTIINILRGNGCGINPTKDDIEYNIQLLTDLKQKDSTNLFIVKHLARQYYYLFAIEQDTVLKNKNKLHAIHNNKMLLASKPDSKTKVWALNNLVLIYILDKNCTDAMHYYHRMNKKEKKFINKNTGAEYYLKNNCVQQ